MKSNSSLAILTLLLVCSGCYPTVESLTMIDPIGAKVGATTLLDRVGYFNMARSADGSFAVVRTNPVDREYDGRRYLDRGYIVESYNGDLGVRWSYTIPDDAEHPITPIHITGNGDAVCVIYSRSEAEDSTSFFGLLLDHAKGTVRSTRYLTGLFRPAKGPLISEKRFTFSPDSSHFAFYHYDYSKLDGSENGSVGLSAELFDSNLKTIGSASLEMPVGDDVDEADDAEPYVQAFVVANDGHGYQVSYHGASTLRLTQFDFTTGSSRNLEKDIPSVDLSDDDRQLHATRIWTGPGEQVLLAASRLDGDDLTAIMLVEMNFQRNSVDRVKIVEIDASLAEKLGGDEGMEWFTVRNIMRTPTGEIILAVEEVEYETAVSEDRGAFFKFTAFKIYYHKDMVVMGFDANAQPTWYAVQHRPKRTTTSATYCSDSWRIEQDSVRCIYRDADADGLVAVSIAAKTGSVNGPKPLIQTSMDAANHTTQWLGSNEALIVLARGGLHRLARLSF